MPTFTFLESDRPLTKKYTKHPDGSITKESFLNAYEVTTHQAQCSSLKDFYVELRTQANKGRCLLKGNTSRPLVKESRAGSTDADAPTDWVCLDFDGLDTELSVDKLLEEIGLGGVSYVLQWSSSQSIIDKTLRCHVFFFLDRPYPAPVLKQWLVQLNHRNEVLRRNQKLTKTNLAISWPLDITACQNDKLIYITPPQLVGVMNPLGRRPRYELIPHTLERLSLGTINTPETNKLLTIARVNELRAAAGLPARKLTSKLVGDVDVLPKPDEAMVTGFKVDRGFAYFNLNGGDSWAYYHPVDNVEIIYNFKGEPNYLTKELLPDYYKKAKSEARSTERAESSLGVHVPSDDRPVLLAFRDRRTGTYYHGTYTPATDILDLAVARSEKQVRDFCMQERMPIDDFIPIWDLNFEPQADYRIDIESRRINTYARSPYLRAAEPKAGKLPKTIGKVLRHMLADDQPTIEHFLNWLAFMAQTRERPNTAWVLYGTEGTGKGTFCSKVLRPLFGMGQTAMRPGAQLSSEYNNFLKGNVLVMFDEAHVAEMRDSEEIHAKLRNWITEPTVSLRMMYSNPVEIDNNAAFILLSNQPNVIHLQKKDRRWNIAPFQDKKIELTDEEVREEIPTELQAFANFLMAWSVDRVKARTPLVTDDRDRLISTTTSSADDVAYALSKDTAQMGFFIDQLPTDTKFKPPLLVQNKIDDYRRTLHDIVLRTMYRGDGKCNISRDELYNIFEYTVGKMPATPNKFTKFLAHRHIHTEKVRIDKPVYGIQVSFKDFSLFPDYLKEHWPSTAVTNK